MSQFVALDPPPTGCGAYGSGRCCWDRHFNRSVVLPEEIGPLCGLPTGNMLTSDKKIVNCKECLELIHS